MSLSRGRHSERAQYITYTDLAKGDDRGAVWGALARSQEQSTTEVFASAYGNRSSHIAYYNLRHDNALATSVLSENGAATPATVIHGADRPTGQKQPYELNPNSIEYQIHGDIGRNDTRPLLKIPDFQGTTPHYQHLLNTETQAHLLSLGATTELVKALSMLGECNNILSVALMGGALTIQGNTGPFQEANFRHDPLANQTILELATRFGIPVLLITLDATEEPKVLFTKDRWKFLKNKFGRHPGALNLLDGIAGPTSTYGSFYLSRTYHAHYWPYEELPYRGVPLHDLTALLAQEDWLGPQELFQYTQLAVRADEQGTIGRARDYMMPNHQVTAVGPVKDFDRFWDTIVKRFKRFG